MDKAFSKARSRVICPASTGQGIITKQTITKKLQKTIGALSESISPGLTHGTQDGYFLTSEWQAEAPVNFMYHSTDGEAWTSVELPAAERKNRNGDCCYAATIDRLCVDDSENVFVSYAESDQFHGSTWSSIVDELSPEKVNWAQLLVLPDDVRCDVVLPNDFIPRSLREKTS